jgi:hypothetical protein
MHIIPGLQLVPSITFSQLPLGPQVLHTGQLVTLQQRLFTQLPVVHSPAPLQPWPGLLLHAGPGTQLFEIEQVSGSSPAVTGLHVPLVFAQLWHVPVQEVLQHLLSEHRPVTQSVPKLQMPPCLVLQTPLESQIWAPMQVVSTVSSAFMMAMHAPPPPVQA